MKLIALSLLLSSQVAVAANWQLDNEKSSLYFVSVKNDVVAETHQFNQLSGSWDGKTVSITVPVMSMQTNIPIRNERIWQYVLQAEQYANIKVSVPLSDDSVAALSVNNSTVLDLPLTITIAKEQAMINSKVRITKLSDNTLQASSESPLMLNTNSFNLTAGVAKLQELAGLKRIDPLVPVSFNVRFSPQ
ncbi:YceI family protein [Rheinheimera metallidurans]|uniref:YceI family protein n=1 Tax=Rheinheimera metallidurans TaxID=2925781 RepID=UPI00300316CC